MPRATKKLEVGKEVLAECKKCKAETVHVITVVKDDKISKVICNACQSTHAYRKPKTEEPVKRGPGRPRKTEPSGTPVTRRRGRKKDWPSLRAKIEESDIVDYDINGDFSEVQAIRHKKFGIGVITKVLAENKIEVVFEEDKKVLAQNWET